MVRNLGARCCKLIVLAWHILFAFWVGSLGCDHLIPTIWTHSLGVYSIQNPFHLRQASYHGWIKCRPRNSNRMLQIPPYSHTRAEGESHARISRSICAAHGSDFGNAKRWKAAAYTIGTDWCEEGKWMGRRVHSHIQGIKERALLDNVSRLSFAEWCREEGIWCWAGTWYVEGRYGPLRLPSSA